MTTAIIPAEIVDQWEAHSKAAGECAASAALDIEEWWVHVFTIYHDRLWIAAYETQEEWLQELLDDTPLSIHASLGRATFFYKVKALERLTELGVPMKDTIGAILNAPSAIRRLSSLSDEQISEMDLSQTVANLATLPGRETTAHLEDAMHKTRHWPSQMIYCPDVETLFVCVVEQEWKRDKCGEWTFGRPSKYWLTIKNVPENLLDYVVYCYKFKGTVEMSAIEDVVLS